MWKEALLRAFEVKVDVDEMMEFLEPNSRQGDGLAVGGKEEEAARRPSIIRVAR